MKPPADAPLVLTLDVGTSSMRALLFDAHADALPGMEARRPYALCTTADGGIEGDAEALVTLVEEVLDELLEKAGGRARQIQAVGCCTFWHSLVGMDRDGAPLTPVYTWGDTRAAPLVATLRARFDEREYHARTGAFFHPVYHPAKLLWLGARAAPRWVSFGELLYQRLFGRTTATLSMASATGLLDVHTCRYDADTMRAAGIHAEQLSPLGCVSDALRGLRDDYATRWPALAKVPWTPPVGDGACDNLGSGCATPERIAVMIGTSGAMRVVWATDRPTIPWGLWCYRVDRRRIVLGGALSDGGNLVAWCRRTFRLGSPEEVERELAAMEPDAHGLTFLPFLAGERSPGFAPHARAAIAGLGLSTRPIHLLRAGMEAIALRFALLSELLADAVPQAREVVASGGALDGSRAWTQILADALGRTIVPSAEREASARGAALLTLEAIGSIERLEDVPASVGAPIAPDPARHAIYRGALTRQRKLYAPLVGG